MKVGIGADPFGIALKEELKAHLEQLGHECIDLGGQSSEEKPYYQVANELGERMQRGELERGVLVCGTGMGMAIVANKHPGVYAAVCEDAACAKRARSINNANVLTLGGMLTAPFKAKEIVDAFFETPFKSGWEPSIQAFLDKSMVDIRGLESAVFEKK